MSDFVNELELSVRARNALQAHGVNTLDDFMKIKDTDILGFQNCGRKTWTEIEGLQTYYRNVARGAHDLAQIRGMLSHIKALCQIHPYFVVSVGTDGHLRAIDTRGEDGADG